MGGLDKGQFERLITSLDKESVEYKELLEQFSNINSELGVGMFYAQIDVDQDEYRYVVDGRGTVKIGYKQSKADFA